MQEKFMVNTIKIDKINIKSYNKSIVNENHTQKEEDNMSIITTLTMKEKRELIMLMAKTLGVDMSVGEGATEMQTASETQTAPKVENKSLEQIVTDHIHDLGVPAHIKGYTFLRAGIMMTIGDPSILGAITKGLYPAVAKEFNSTPSRVERAIRHAIETSWIRCNPEIQKEMFGNTIDAEKGKPTNSEYIALLTDHIRMQHM